MKTIMISNPPLLPPSALRLSQLDRRHEVGIVCVGDSVTGYNNFEEPWPLRTYPDFLQQLVCEQVSEKVVLNAGQAGALSETAPKQTAECLRLFPNSTDFVLGFGTNDLCRVEETEIAQVSEATIANMSAAIRVALEAGKQVTVFNVPHLNAKLFGKGTVARSRRMREYHNGKLAAFCAALPVRLADVCSRLQDEHFADALHPNEAGAKLIAETIAAVMFD
jgi:lysophospholipase L1-like esterase